MGLHGYIDKQLQHTNENVLYRAHISWVPMLTGVIPTMAIASTAGGVLWGVTTNPLFGFAALALGGAIAVVSRIPKIVYNLGVDICVTDKRLHTKTGIININDDHETQLTRINDTVVDPSIIGRLFDYANVTIQTVAGEDDFTFKCVANPYGLRDALNNARDMYQSSAGSGQNPVGMAPRRHKSADDSDRSRSGGDGPQRRGRR